MLVQLCMATSQVSTPLHASPSSQSVSDVQLKVQSSRQHRVAEGTVSNAAPAELVFAIPTGKAVTVVQLTGTAETSVGGARVDLLHREGATGIRIAAPLFLNGTTQQIALMKQLASGSIVLRRTNGSGAPVFVYAEWDGYVEDA